LIFGKHINRYYLRYLHFFLLGIGALLLVDFLQLEIPELYRIIINGMSYGEVEIDGVLRPFDTSVVLDVVCLPMIGIILLMVLGRFLWRVALYGAAIRIETDIRSRMLGRAKDLSQQYYQRNKVGNLMSLFTNDLETLQECFGDGVLMMFDALLLGTLAIIKMAGMNIILTVLSLIPMLLLLAVGTLVGKYMSRKWEARQEAFSALSDFAQESFSGISVVKAFVKEARELWAFKKLNKNNEDVNVEFTRASTLLHILVTLFVESVVCIILGYGGYLVYLGVFDAGELIEFISYFNSIVWPVMAVSQLIDMSARGRASYLRVAELIDETPDVCDAAGAEDLDPVCGNIEFRGLTFRYPGADYDALKNINFSVKAGEFVGIIGRTGAGKTTLVDLILRTYNARRGQLFIDGRDVNDLTVSSVRAAAAYVPQDNFLFSDTIENNIGFSIDSPSIEDVTRVAKMADVHSNISEFPMGYSTVLGERGVTVSGGQKQRISIARALLKDAPILILDDAVSAVDTETEHNIISALRRERKGKTTILIAHRVSTVEGLDRIVYLDDGELVDVGTHAELLTRCTEYSRMVQLQKLMEVEGNE